MSKDTNIDNYDEFMNLFNECEVILNSRAKHKNQDFITLLKDAQRTDRVVRQFYDDINSYRELRNVLVHNKTKAKLAEPYSHVVEGFKNIVKTLKNPPKARDIMTSPIITFQVEESIAVAANEMYRYQLTNVPVYEGDNLVGILSEQSFVEWIALSYKDDGFIASELKLKEIVKFLHSPTGTKHEKYYFASPELDAYSVEDKFSEAINQGSRLNAIFVTHNGKQDNKILGIITPWDLPKKKSNEKI